MPNFITDDPPLLCLVLVHCVSQSSDLFVCQLMLCICLIGETRSHHIVRPRNALSFELGAVPDLQGTAASPGEVLGDPLPRQFVLLLQLNEQGVVLERELGFRAGRRTSLRLGAGLAGAHNARFRAWRACHAARALELIGG